MTRDEAILKTKIAMNHPGGVVWCSNQQEANEAIAKIERDAEHFVDAAVILGLLKLEELKPSESLWKILRSRGVALDIAQWVCNDALKAGVLRSPQETAHD